MASFHWKTGASGDWNTATGWTENGIPNGVADNVVIDAVPLAGTTSYRVKIAAGASDTVNTLVLAARGTDLEVDGTLTFAPGSTGELGYEYNNSQLYINGGTIVNAGLIFASIHTTGNVVFTGANPLYIGWSLQVVEGTATLDTKSLGPYDASKNLLFDGIYEALGAGRVINLGGKSGGLVVAAETLSGPKATLTPNYWTQITLKDVGSQVNEWNGSTYVSVETTLKLIENAAYVTVTGGRNYTTTNTLAIGKDGVFEEAGGTLSTGGLTLLAGGLLIGGVSGTGTTPGVGQVTVIGAVTNNGQIVAEGPGMVFRNAISGTGAISFNRTAPLPGFTTPVGAPFAGVLEVGAVGAGQTVTMSGSDTLILDNAAVFAGTIANFDSTDKVFINSAVAITSATYAAGANGIGTVTLLSGATVVGTVAVAGNFDGKTFQVTPGATANSYSLISNATPPAIVRFVMTDTTTGVSSSSAGEVYSGPVVGLQSQYITVTTDSLNIASITPNSFIHTGSGSDAIDVSRAGGNNVLDGSTGSNFLVGGTGNDTFFVDDRAATADIWSTIVNFHAGDAVTIFGVRASGFNFDYEDNQGAVGSTGLTLHATAPGKPIASMTLAGYTKADLSNGRLGVAFGTEPNGDSYMYFKGA